MDEVIIVQENRAGEAVGDDEEEERTIFETAAFHPSLSMRMRRATLAGVVGNGVIWMFPDNLYLDPNTNVTFWNFSGSSGGALQINVTLEE